MSKTPTSPNKTPPQSPNKKVNASPPKSPRVTRSTLKQTAETKDTQSTSSGQSDTLASEETIGPPSSTSTQNPQFEQITITQQPPENVTYIIQEDQLDEFNRVNFENSDIAGKAVLVKRSLPAYMHAFFDEVFDERLDKHCFTIENPLNPSVLKFNIEMLEYELLKALQTFKNQTQAAAIQEPSASDPQPKQTPAKQQHLIPKNSTAEEEHSIPDQEQDHDLVIQDCEVTVKDSKHHKDKPKRRKKKARTPTPEPESDENSESADEEETGDELSEEEESDEEEDDSEEDETTYRNGKYGFWDRSLYTKGKRRKRFHGEIVVRKCRSEPDCLYMESGSSNNIIRHTENNHRDRKPKYIATYMEKKLYNAMKQEYEERDREKQEKLNKESNSSKKKKRKKSATPKKHKEPRSPASESDSDNRKKDRKKSKRSTEAKH